MTTFIYALECPLENQIRYIGKANDPIYRFKNHMNRGRDKNTHKRNWINKLRDLKLKPKLIILEEVSINIWKEREKYWIRHYKELGNKLVNCTEGGDGLQFGNKTSFKIGQGKIPILVLDLVGNIKFEFDSLSDARLILKLNLVHQNKEQKTSHGFIILKKSQYLTMSVEDLAYFINNSMTKKKIINSGCFKKGERNIKRQVPILMLDKNTGEILKEYECISDAVKEFNSSSILQNLIGRNKTALGYKWKYKNK